MKRLITLLIVILALIAGAGRTEVAITTDCTPVSAEIAKEQVSLVETPAEAAVSPVSPLVDDEVINADPCETEPETTDCATLPDTVAEAETEPVEIPTEEKTDDTDILFSTGEPAIEPAFEAEPGDSGDRVTAETDIEKMNDPAVTVPKNISEIATEPEPTLLPELALDPVIVPNKPTIETSHADEPDAEQQGDANAPVFIDPCQGGPNPFDDDTPSVIDDHNSDEFVGDGDRPGEGIHF